jgi:hypothetical protein
MALNTKFLENLDREIASLKERIVGMTVDDPLLRETEARLSHLEETRQKVIEQSHGG